VATGLALTLFGLGFSALLGQGYVGIKRAAGPDWDIPRWPTSRSSGGPLPARSGGLSLLLLVAAVWAS
jgi:general nucleoside transport system permease protein